MEGRRWRGSMVAKVHGARSSAAAGREPAIGVTGLAVWWLRERAHEVSILIATAGSVGRDHGELLRAKTSMMIMRPPQHGQG